jgi:hypothetical protein
MSNVDGSNGGQQLAAQVGGTALLDLAGNTLAQLDSSGTEPAWQRVGH